MRKRFSFLLIAPLALIFLFAEAPMAFGKTLFLASQLNGKLVDGSGAPQAGIKIVRRWNWAWGDETGRDEATTGPDGSFSFPEITGSSWSAGFMPHTPSIMTVIDADLSTGQLRLLSVDKFDYEKDSELKGTPLTGPGINVVCRIDKEPSGDGPFWGTCEAP